MPPRLKKRSFEVQCCMCFDKNYLVFTGSFPYLWKMVERSLCMGEASAAFVNTFLMYCPVWKVKENACSFPKLPPMILVIISIYASIRFKEMMPSNLDSFILTVEIPIKDQENGLKGLFTENLIEAGEIGWEGLFRCWLLIVII